MRILGPISKLTDTLGKSATPIFKKYVHVALVDASTADTSVATGFFQSFFLFPYEFHTPS